MDRIRLKNNAKFILRKHYLVLLIVSFIVAVLGGGTSGSFGWSGHGDTGHHKNIERDINKFTEKLKDNGVLEYGSEVIARGFNGLPLGKVVSLFLAPVFILLSVAIALAAVFFVIFIAFPVKVGAARAFISIPPTASTSRSLAVWPSRLEAAIT
jgi:hypothetical protein